MQNLDDPEVDVPERPEDLLPAVGLAPDFESNLWSQAEFTAGSLARGRKRDLESGTTGPEVVKIVYWGPGRSGKTTNLKWLHSRLRPELRGRLIDLEGEGDRTLYFDCLPIDLDASGRNRRALRVYTVPGQPRFRLTRRLVLDGVDGIVFVWDVRARRLNANLASLIEMRETLAELGLAWVEIPRIVQYNKFDLPDRIPTEELDHVLDRMGERSLRLSSVATKGIGILETLGAITSAVLSQARPRRRRM